MDTDTNEKAETLLDQYAAELESAGVVASMAQTTVAHESAEATCALHLLERECLRLSSRVGEVAGTLHRERSTAKEPLEGVEDAIRDYCDDIKRLAEPGSHAARLADEIISGLEDGGASLSEDQEKDELIREILETVEKQPRLERLAFLEVIKMVSRDDKALGFMKEARANGLESFSDMLDYMMDKSD